MGNVFKKTVTRTLPPNAEIITRQGERLARWRDAKGKTKTAPVIAGKDGAERIRDESSTYVARYRDGDGMVVEVSTGCRDKSAAQNVLADLERKAVRVNSGMLTSAEARTSEHLATPIGEHLGVDLNALAAAGAVPVDRSKVKTDPKLLDVWGAHDALPNLPLAGGPTVVRERARATKTDALGHGADAPFVELNRGNGRQTPFMSDTATAELPNSSRQARLAQLAVDLNADLPAVSGTIRGYPRKSSWTPPKGPR